MNLSRIFKYWGYQDIPHLHKITFKKVYITQLKSCVIYTVCIAYMYSVCNYFVKMSFEVQKGNLCTFGKYHTIVLK